MSNIVHIDDAVSASHLRSSVVDRVPPWLMAYQRCGGQQLHKKKMWVLVTQKKELLGPAPDLVMCFSHESMRFGYSG